MSSDTSDLLLLSDSIASLGRMMRHGPTYRSHEPWSVLAAEERDNQCSRTRATGVENAMLMAALNAGLRYAVKPYRVRNRPEYVTELRRRGELTLWFSEEAMPARYSNGQRDDTIRTICQLGRRGWQKESGYVGRSLDRDDSRYKRVMSRSLRSRTLLNQQTEVDSACIKLLLSAGMPVLWHLGMDKEVRFAWILGASQSIE